MNKQSDITLQSIEWAFIDSPIEFYSCSIEFNDVLILQLNSQEMIYFGYSQEGDDGFTWELTNQGSLIAIGTMPNQESAKDVAEKLYQWISKVPQCLDCTAFISYKISTTFANGVYVASAEINCPNCGESYDINLDETEIVLAPDLKEFGTSRLI